jgi:hypothetical protein
VRRAAVLAAWLGLAIALSGGAGGSGSAQAAVKRALARTADAGSSRFTLSWVNSESEAGPPADYRLDGLMDYVHHRGRISFGRNSELLIDGNMTYMQTALPWRHEPVWVSSETGGQETDPFDLQERALTNPLSLLTFLTGVGTDLREAGSEEIRGVETTHYEGTLNLEAVVESAPPEERPDLQDTLDFIGQFEPTTVPFGLWVDGEGVARRLRVDRKGGGSIVIEYYDFGLSVSITPPPTDAIITSDELFKEVEDHQTDSGCEIDGSSIGGSSNNDQLTLPETAQSGPLGTNAGALPPPSSGVYSICFTIGGG